jgi:hypothetical protein
VQWHTIRPNSTLYKGEFNALCFAKSVAGDSRVDTSSEGREVAPQ